MNILFTIWKGIYCNMGFPGGAAGKSPSASVGHMGSIPGLGGKAMATIAVSLPESQSHV